MFSKEDFSLKNTDDIGAFIFILPFVLLIAPFLVLAYHIGLILDITDTLDKP
ncbi:MAG: hypothetical protein OXC44_08480 [Proteobacteria bacterium]|nr:hypothetical protein [Pseudomonadota bacterium]